ncbi:hypothetical protein TNCV_3760621 [Trichonephila clavipes]|nr:hypothetical protein TNCV_3760621 [Trichonephila clavipes]
MPFLSTYATLKCCVVLSSDIVPTTDGHEKNNPPPPSRTSREIRGERRDRPIPRELREHRDVVFFLLFPQEHVR